MKGRTITSIFVGSMLTVGLISGMAFADTVNTPSKEDRMARQKMKHEKRLEAMAEILDLSEAQQEQIRALHEQERVAMEETLQQMREGREQMRDLLESYTFNEVAIRNLAKAQESLKTELFVSRAKVRHEVFQLLTSEQQELSKKLKPLLHKQEKHHPPMRGI